MDIRTIRIKTNAKLASYSTEDLITELLYRVNNGERMVNVEIDPTQIITNEEFDRDDKYIAYYRLLDDLLGQLQDLAN